MGTWGAGNFDSDDALDYLDIVLDRFWAVLWKFFAIQIKDKTMPEPTENEWPFSESLFEIGEATILPTMDILIILSERYDCSYQAALETLLRWKFFYLELFDESMADWEETSEFVVKRRRIIEDTFDKFIKLRESEPSLVEPFVVQIVTVIDKESEEISVEFDSLYGKGTGVWQGNVPEVGKSYLAYLEIEKYLTEGVEIIKWAEEITKAEGSEFFVICEVENCRDDTMDLGVEHSSISVGISEYSFKRGDRVILRTGTGFILRETYPNSCN